jgi:alkylhydroperoxidase/carboxymuconolactone decarboxylase family protein YurZ
MKEESLEMLRTFFGANGDSFAASIETSQPEFAKLVDEFGLQKIWSRKGLPLREKSLLTISSQAALGRWDQVEIHMKSFLHLGGTKEDLKEVLIHLAMYCGFPTAIAGFRIVEGLS